MKQKKVILLQWFELSNYRRVVSTRLKSSTERSCGAEMFYDFRAESYFLGTIIAAVSFTIVFRPVFLLLHRHAELHEDTGKPIRASTLLRARGVERRRPGDDGSMVRMTLCVH